MRVGRTSRQHVNRLDCASSPARTSDGMGRMTTLVSLPGSQDNVASFWKSYRPKLAANGGRTTRRGRYAPRVSGAGPTLSLTKRAFDVMGALTGLLFLLPIFVAIALAIKATSRGPVFF